MALTGSASEMGKTHYLEFFFKVLPTLSLYSDLMQNE